MRPRRSYRSLLVVLITSMLMSAFLLAPMAAAQDEATNQSGAKGDVLPDIRIDALAENQWSIEEIHAAPGQKLIVTNRDVERHTFVVSDWDVYLTLPLLTPVEVVVLPGDVVTLYSDVGS